MIPCNGNKLVVDFAPRYVCICFSSSHFEKVLVLFLCPLLHPNHGNSNWKLTYSWNTGKWSWQHCWKIYRLWICNISDDNYRETGKKKELRENRKKNWTKKNSNVYLFFGPGGVNGMYVNVCIIILVCVRPQTNKQNNFDRNANN